MRTDVLISKVNNRLQASLRTLRGNRYITINGVLGPGISLDGPDWGDNLQFLPLFALFELWGGDKAEPDFML